ncbi:uncharacterized protein ARMOST_12534 [Armillaria ostoyae]|uniref:Uncharacterized protein n=1 Tax=Armillaria ostoyae TaxID=47428 RepID=A0A284RK68_ARMOS|nr:uncharacterized protein ARMOST_12534 [Armillaria ostoyae]
MSKWCVVEHRADDQLKDIPSSKWQKVAGEAQVISKKDPIQIFHQQNLESVLAKVQARNDYELDCSPYGGSSNTFAQDLDHLSAQETLSFAPIQKLLSHWASSSHQRTLAMHSKLVYRQQEQLSILVLWGCIDKLLLDAWKSHDSFLNPLHNLFHRASSLLTNNQTNFRSRFLRVDPTEQAVINVCQDLLSQWLGLDWEGSYKSALVVQFFVDHLGVEAALLDLQKFDLSTPPKVADLKTVIMNSPIYHVGGVERLLLHQIASVSGAPDQDNLTAILSRMPRCTITEYDNQSLPFFGEQDMSTFPSSSTHLTSLISSGPSHVASLPSSPQSSSSNVPTEFNVRGNLKQLKLMFELSYPLLDNLSEPYSPFNTTPKLTSATQNFITYVAADTDTRSIFRDLASSRTQSLRSGGPFNPVNLRTSAGFFSALMGRGVLHHTEYLNDSNNPVFFIDENHWKTIRNESLGHKAEGYFCNKRAYSNQPNGKRTSENASQYWKAASNSKYNKFLFTEKPTPFIELWDHFRKGMYCKEGQPVVKLFPQFGALQAYLLASDYAIAGLATMPTDAEMAVVIATIDSGGIKGISFLGLPCSGKEEIALSFKCIHEYLSHVIPAPCQQQMNFNAFIVEHSLCKCSSPQQLNNKNFLAVENCLKVLRREG